MLQYLSISEADTGKLAASIARLLKPGDAIFLSGELGAGKTVFIRTAAKELGVDTPVTSPSFTIGQTYAGMVKIHHLDLFRLAEVTGADAAELEPFFEADAITFVEWPQRGAGGLAEPAMIIQLDHIDETSRLISFCRVRDDLKKKVEDLIAGSRF
ncbi:MAG: tRNA (adenosine(37)-N6)-threonylcarbamoyltransferase complex ATPase subunit type 1 TsaE [Actinobacteria bacterium]|nr:tRNA (adenosine(37)-N6)-threonylcarbamoyltransferase complex ATPase subunit type 1 TsaE [Actinomycetota bacterium]